ncbi:type VI secretion system lipoprotein TssJ [Stenotrophomonas humi]
MKHVQQHAPFDTFNGTNQNFGRDAIARNSLFTNGCNHSGKKMNSSFRTNPILAAASILLLATTGCASKGKVDQSIDATLQNFGIREAKPQKPPVVPLRIYAGTNLNSGNDGNSAASVVKIYHLRSSQRFERAPFNAFLDHAGEQAALGSDLLSVNEIVLMPGARQELSEKLSHGTTRLGVVALFRAPAENRWRLTFDASAKTLADSGITLGVHACALTSDSDALTSRFSGDALSLASIKCGTSK